MDQDTTLIAARPLCRPWRRCGANGGRGFLRHLTRATLADLLFTLWLRDWGDGPFVRADAPHRPLFPQAIQGSLLEQRRPEARLRLRPGSVARGRRSQEGLDWCTRPRSRPVQVRDYRWRELV